MWTIPIQLVRGRVQVSAGLNGSHPLSLLLDTGYGLTMLEPDIVEQQHELRRSGSITILGVSGNEQAGLYRGAAFLLGEAHFAPRRVGSLPSDSHQRRRTRDGILGADFFKRFVVELDCAQKAARLFEPDSFQYTGNGEIIPISFPRDTPVIEAAVLSPANEEVRGRFAIDTGCDGEMCLAHDFTEANRLLGDAGGSRSSSKYGVGGGSRVVEGSLPQLKLGRLKLDHTSATFFLEGSPASEGLAGHIGMSALRQFKVIFDYRRNRMILEQPESSAPR